MFMYVSLHVYTWMQLLQNDTYQILFLSVNIHTQIAQDTLKINQ